MCSNVFVNLDHKWLQIFALLCLKLVLAVYSRQKASTSSSSKHVLTIADKIYFSSQESFDFNGNQAADKNRVCSNTNILEAFFTSVKSEHLCFDLSPLSRTYQIMDMGVEKEQQVTSKNDAENADEDTDHTNGNSGQFILSLIILNFSLIKLITNLQDEFFAKS